MKPYLAYIAFTLFLLVFLFFKTELLNVPLFWDELGVYGKGIFQMIEQGPSLFPSSLDPEISRGHPLLFTFLISLFSLFLGPNIWGLRISVLFISLATLTSFHLLMRKSFRLDFNYAFLGTVFLSFQALFFAQSTMILPEMLLSLFVVLMLLGYRQHIWLYLIAASCALLTKESALVLILCFAFYEQIFNKEKNHPFKRSLVLLLPVIPFIGFLIVQKYTYGWYFFPYHSSSFEMSFGPFWEKIKGLVGFLFFSQGRWLSTLFFIMITIYILLTNAKKLKQDLLLLALLISSYIGFHSFSFNMNRYLLPILPLYSLLIVMSISMLPAFSLKRKVLKSVSYLTLFGLSIFACFFWYPKLDINEFNHDDDMSYLNHTEASIAVLNHLKNQNLDDSYITMTFPLILAVEDPKYGYISKGQFKNAQILLDSLSEYLIQQTPPFINPSNLSEFEQEIIKELSHKNVRTRIFSLKKNELN